MDAMDAKRLLVSPAPTQQQRQVRWKVLAWPLASLILLYTLIPHFRLRLQPIPCHETAGVRYEGERIFWESCGEITGHPLECSDLIVPMNHFAPPNSSDADEEEKVFTIPLIRMRAKNATQNLIINPGGPGGSGVQFVYAIGDELNTILDEGYHILSFDPRGVNGSRPKAECYPDEALRRAHAMPRSGRLSETGDMYAWNKNFARACYDNMGEHAKYINTPQTAADMNSILDALGQEDMIYWGFSYGTTLGQTYATMYPERSKRVVIDGVANINDTYRRLDPEQKHLSDSDKVLYGFFDECVKAGPDRCALAPFGSTADELWEAVLSRVDKLRDEPLSVYVNSTVYGIFDYPNLLTNAIFYTLYAPKRSWSPVAGQLARFLEGNATELWMEHGRADHYASIGEAIRFVTFNDAKSGPEYWPQGRQDVVDEIVRVANGSLFSRIDMTGFFGRQQWIVPRTHDFVPQERVETAHPLLILTTSYDPICPIRGAFFARDMFVGSQIVELKGYGHCSDAMPSLCVAQHVKAYFDEGKVPENHTQCEVDGDYFPSHGEDENVMEGRGLLSFNDLEMERIHLAQSRLARKWPAW